jgi:hypothetical protein
MPRMNKKRDNFVFVDNNEEERRKKKGDCNLVLVCTCMSCKG